MFGGNNMRFAVNSGFLSLNTGDIWGQIIICCGGCPLHHLMLAAPLASAH